MWSRQSSKVLPVICSAFLAVASETSTAGGFLGDIARSIDLQVRSVTATAATVAREKKNFGNPDPADPAPTGTPLLGSNGRPVSSAGVQNSPQRSTDVAPISVSKIVRDQTDIQRSAVAAVLQDDVQKLQEQLDERLAIEPKTAEVLTQISALNDTLSAKRQAYDFALGKKGVVSAAAAESFVAASNPWFLMCGDEIWTRRDPLKWREQLTPVKSLLIKVGRSVGVIMVNDRLAGTAFVVKHGMIVTNAHVLRAVADYDAKKKLWRVKPGASVTFDRERELGVDANCPTALPDKTYALNGVIYAAPDASTDVKNENIRDDLAVILSSTDDKFPSQLTVSTRAAEKYASKMVLAIIGYPGPPEQMSIGERMQYFSAPDTITPVFPYKRLAEGYCGDRAANADGIFAHLVNTAGGNSGSPIIDLADGSIVGIHVRGEDSDFVSAKNYGISGERIIAVLARAGVLP